MLSGEAISLVLVPLLLVLSAFFSSSEAAYLSLERLKVAHLVSTGTAGARRVQEMINHPERLLSTILLGNNLVNVAFTAVVTVLAVGLLGDGTGVVAATAVGTTALLVVGEILPKTLAVHYAQPVALLYARPLVGIETLLWPLVVTLRWLTRTVSALFQVSSTAGASITEAELRTMINIGESEGTFDPAQADMLERVFRFGNRRTREVMTPRPEIVSLNERATLREFFDIYLKTSHTRFIVYGEQPDDIVGVISAKDVLRTLATGEVELGAPVAGVVRKATLVPEAKRVVELFDDLRNSGSPMAIVVDEYGGLSGLVTLKQLAEEVVGSIGEEGVGAEGEWEPINQNTFLVDGGMSIDEANDELGINLPAGDYDTVAGFVLEILGHIPIKGERFEFEDLRFEIAAMARLKVETVRVTKTRLESHEEVDQDSKEGIDTSS